MLRITAQLPTATEIAALVERLDARLPDATDAERIDLLTGLEALKSAAAAAQARVTAAFDASQRAAQQSRGGNAGDRGKASVASQVALARHDSPVKGGRHLGLALALVHEMPHTLAALAAGDISEWRATIVVRETAVLTSEHRSQVDAELAGRLAGLGDRGTEAEARKIAYRLDPTSVLRRSAKAEQDRRVSLRPAPDTMSRLTGLLPVAQGVAVHASLRKHADALRAAGDPRSRGQIMADTLVERVTGQAAAAAVPVEVELVMSDRTLFGHDDSPARIHGYGPVPAALARALVRGGRAAGDAKAWVRRLYASPETGALVAMDSTRRIFPEGLRRFLVVRDETCRTPWCDAPIRHADHVDPAASGGPTSAANGQGLCVRCNQVKESTGWRATVDPTAARSTVRLRAPTGHIYTSRAPDPPGFRHPDPHPSRSPLEAWFARLVA